MPPLQPISRTILEDGSSDDVASQYVQHVGVREDESAIQELESLMAAEEEPAPPAPEGNVNVPGVATTAQSVEQPDPDEGSTAGRIMRGFAETVGSGPVGGAIDAVNSALEAADGIGQFIEDSGLGIPSVQIMNEEGAFDPALVSSRIEGAGPVEIPNLPEPTTPEGRASREVFQFLVGFFPALKVVKSTGFLKGGGKFLQETTAGALADAIARSGSEERLSDLWQSMGLPDNVLTDFLASGPNDTEFEGRLKNALEGAVVGGVVEPFIKSIRVIKSVKNAIAGKDGAETTAKTALRSEIDDGVAATIDDDFKLLGDPKADKVLVRQKLKTSSKKVMQAGVEVGDGTSPQNIANAGEAVARRRETEKNLKNFGLVNGMPGRADIGTKEVFINFSRIDSPDDVKEVLARMVDSQAGAVNEARRGVQTNAQTKKLAERMGMSVDDLLNRRHGAPLNAEEALAARQLMNASANVLLKVAKQAAHPNAGAVDLFAFRKMMSVHAAIQKEVVAARTETARALQSWSIPAGEKERTLAIEAALDTFGGRGVTEDFAKRLAILADAGATPSAVSKFVEKAAGANTADVVKEFWINGLLSSPKTHVVNITSNSLVAMQQVMERGFAESMNAVVDNPQGIQPGEAAAMMHGLVSSIPDALRLAYKSLKSGEVGASLGKSELNKRAISSDHMKNQTGAMANFVDYLGAAVNVPGRLLGAEDEFFKTIGYRMEARAQAVRQATSEGLTGKALADRVVDLVNDPPENIRIAAADAALYNTFTNKAGWFGQTFMKAKAADSQLNPMFLVLPFVRTPVNIARYSFERTPFAPLVGQWREDIAAGGARGQLAMARMSTGTMLMAMAVDMADKGLISGRGDPNQGQRANQKALGQQQYSLKVGDTWYSYNRTDPLGMLMGFAADINEAVRYGEMDEEHIDEMQEIMGLAITAVSQVTINKTYLSGLSELITAVHEPQRYAGSYVNELIGSFVPGTALMGAVARANDPEQKEINSPADAVYSRIAGLTSKLYPRRDRWGARISTESGKGRAYDFLSPITASPVKDSPIDQELLDQRINVSKIAKKTQWSAGVPGIPGGSVNVNFRNFPDVYDRYVELAGNGSKDPTFGMGTKDLLDAMVTGESPLSAVYEIGSDGPDGTKADQIRKIITQGRQRAQAEIMNDKRFADFHAHIIQKQQEKFDQQFQNMR